MGRCGLPRRCAARNDTSSVCPEGRHLPLTGKALGEKRIAAAPAGLAMTGRFRAAVIPRNQSADW